MKGHGKSSFLPSVFSVCFRVFPWLIVDEIYAHLY